MKTMKTITSFVELAIVLAIAYGLDRWEKVVRTEARKNFDGIPIIWFTSVANLILASSLLALAWLLCFQASKNGWVSLAFVIFGLLATFAFAISYLIQADLVVQRLPGFLLPNSRVVYVSSFVTAIGIARLILSKE